MIEEVCIHNIKLLFVFMWQIYYNKADIGGDNALSADILQLFDYMFYYYVEYFFSGPKPEVLPQFWNLSYPFDDLTWVLVTIVLILMSFLAMFIQFSQKVINVVMIYLECALYIHTMKDIIRKTKWQSLFY